MISSIFQRIGNVVRGPEGKPGKPGQPGLPGKSGSANLILTNTGSPLVNNIKYFSDFSTLLTYVSNNSIEPVEVFIDSSVNGYTDLTGEYIIPPNMTFNSLNRFDLLIIRPTCQFIVNSELSLNLKFLNLDINTINTSIPTLNTENGGTILFNNCNLEHHQSHPFMIFHDTSVTLLLYKTSISTAGGDPAFEMSPNSNIILFDNSSLNENSILNDNETTLNVYLDSTSVSNDSFNNTEIHYLSDSASINYAPSDDTKENWDNNTLPTTVQDAMDRLHQTRFVGAYDDEKQYYGGNTIKYNNGAYFTQKDTLGLAPDETLSVTTYDGVGLTPSNSYAAGGNEVGMPFLVYQNCNVFKLKYYAISHQSTATVSLWDNETKTRLVYGDITGITDFDVWYDLELEGVYTLTADKLYTVSVGISEVCNAYISSPSIESNLLFAPDWARFADTGLFPIASLEGVGCCVDLEATLMNPWELIVQGVPYTLPGVPTCSPESALGIGGSIAASGNDHGGIFTIVSGSSDISTGDLATITFSSSIPEIKTVILTPVDVNANNSPFIFVRYNTISSSGFKIFANDLVNNEETQRWSYAVID
jgi:hypothetical protein